MNKILKKDLEKICYNSNINFEEFNEKTFLVTGATGLIGFSIIASMLYYGTDKEKGPIIYALVRDIAKAKEMYREFDTSKLIFIVGDVCESISIDANIDYIIHGASQTMSKAFVDSPVETIYTSFFGTDNLLRLARQKKVKGFIYLSSMEVYGAPADDVKINEMSETNLNTMATRSCYPESKRMCENLCSSYFAEYGVPAKVVRLTQTFGPGVQYNDRRVFAEFARCAIEGRDIILHTMGETKRNYLYTADAVTAILTVLTLGKPGEAYNAANENTYCSIMEMAKLVAENCAKGKISVKIENADINLFGYAPKLFMNLATDKLMNMGWKPSVDLLSMYNNLIEYMQIKRQISHCC